MHWYDGGWGMGGGLVLWTLILVAVVVVLVFFVFRGNGLGQRSTNPSDSPEEILKRRYARGEIDRDEYERRLNDLRR